MIVIILRGDKALVRLMIDTMREHCNTFPTSAKLLNFQSKIIESSHQINPQDNDLSDFLRNYAWRQLNKRELTLARISLKINDFVFAEILVDWLRETLPTGEVFLELWSLIRYAELPFNFRTVLTNVIHSIDAR